MCRNALSLALVVSLVLSFTSIPAAEIYKWMDEDGIIHYSDVPPYVPDSPIKYHSYKPLLKKDLTNDSLNKLMTLSRLNKQITEFPKSVWTGMKESVKEGSVLSDAELGKIQKVIIAAFQPAKILNAIRKEIKKYVSESEVKDLLNWYESDLGRRITKAEENASTPAAFQEMVRETQSLLADEERVKLAKKKSNLENVVDMSLQLHENMLTAILAAFATAMKPNEEINREDFKVLISPLKQQLRTNIKRSNIAAFVYVYRDLDTASIEKYIHFQDQSSYRKFEDCINKSSMYELNQSIDKMGKLLVPVLKKYHKFAEN